MQFVRFYWKATPESRDHAGVKCKMLRPVSFPADNWDLFPYCDEQLQRKMRVWRDLKEREHQAGAAFDDVS